MNTQYMNNKKKSKLSYYRVLYFMNIVVGIVLMVLFRKEISLLNFSPDIYDEVFYEIDYLQSGLLFLLSCDMDRYISIITCCILIFALIAVFFSIVFYLKKEKKLQHLFLMLATGLNVLAGLYYLLMHLLWARSTYGGSREFLFFYGILMIYGFAALVRGIFFHKIEEIHSDITEDEIRSDKKISIIIFATLTTLTCACIVLPFIALSKEKKEADIILQARSSQDKTFDEEIGYQIGNYINGECIYVNDKLYFIVSTKDTDEIRYIDKSGNMDVLWVAPDEVISIDSYIYYYEEYLYILVNTSGSFDNDKILRISTTSRKEETLLESEDKLVHLGIHNNLLLVASYQEETWLNGFYDDNLSSGETLYNIYAYDLTIPVTEDNGYLYDYGITYYEFKYYIWINRFLYGNYQLHFFSNPGNIMIIENFCYDRKDVFELYRESPESESEIIDTDVVSYNIFNNKIYYTLRSDSQSHKVYSCDLTGENKVFIGSLPDDHLDFCDSMLMAEDFAILRGYNPETNEPTAYLMWLDDGSYEKLW